MNMPEFEHNEELTMPRNLSIYGVYSGRIFIEYVAGVFEKPTGDSLYIGNIVYYHGITLEGTV